jgi:hypothetical protein
VVIAPKFVRENGNYTTLLVPHKLSENTQVRVRYRVKEFHAFLTNEKDLINLNFENTAKKFRLENGNFQPGFNFNVTARRQKKCKMINVKVPFIRTSILPVIQMDKPFYKPNDKIRFRLITMKNGLNAVKPRSVVIEILDTHHNKIHVFKEMNNTFHGLYEYELQLGENLVFGTWTIHAKINDEQSLIKKFHVDAYTLPLFDVQVEAKNKYAFTEEKMDVFIHGKYAFGRDAKGHVSMSVKSLKTNRNVYMTTFRAETKINKVLSFRNDFKFVQIMDTIALELTVTFVEDLTAKAVTKTIQFTLHDEEKCQIFVSNDQFRPAYSFNFFAKVRSFSGHFIEEDDNSPVHVTLSAQDTSGESSQKKITNKIMAGQADFEIDGDDLIDVENIELKFRYRNCEKIVSVRENPSRTYLSLNLQRKS